MGSEKRRSPRRRVAVMAMMATTAGKMIGLCNTVDMSATGARLEPRKGAEPPDEFLLVLSRDARILRRCKAVWRANGQVGVQFVDDIATAERARRFTAEQPYRRRVGT